jgi:hypothetical protein
MLNKVEKLTEIYKNGVSVNDIQEIANTLKINVIVKDLLERTITDIKCEKDPLRTFKYENSRLNHVEKIIDDNDPVYVYKVKLKEILLEQVKNNNAVSYRGTFDEPKYVYTNGKPYCLFDKDNLAIQEFNHTPIDELDNTINSFKIYKDDDVEKFNFIKKSCLYSSHMFFNIPYDNLRIDSYDEQNNYKRLAFDRPDYIEYDMKKAYSQYVKCNEYIGFPNVMTPIVNLENKTIDFIRDKLGYFNVSINTLHCNENTKLFLNKLGLHHNNTYNLSTPEILFYEKHKMSFVFHSGSYSFKPIHFTIPTELFENRRYCKWAGKLGSCSDFDTIRLLCNDDISNILAIDHKLYKNDSFNIDYKTGKIINDDMKYNEFIVRKQRNNISTLSHIAGFITAYTRLNIYNKLFQMDYDKVICYKLDSIVCEKGIYDNLFDDIWHNDKKPNLNFYSGDYIYPTDDIVKSEYNFTDHKYLLTGKGGTGKTHSVLSNNKNVLISAKIWRIVCSHANTYDCLPISINQLLGINCKKYNHVPSTLFIDEITMISNEEGEKINELYPYSQIFFAGDVEIIDDKVYNYQCKLMNTTIFKNYEGFTKIHYEKSYRCKDDKLLTIIHKIRKMMKGTKFNPKVINDYGLSLFSNVINIAELKTLYNPEIDWVLCSIRNGERSQTQKYLEYFKENNIPCKWRRHKHTTTDIRKKLEGKDIRLNGEITYDKPEDDNKYVETASYTIHSFQGETIKSPSKLFLDRNYLFTPDQLYTAISRVEYLHQIYIVN